MRTATICLSLMFLAGAAPLWAQSTTPAPDEMVELGGPRMGITVLDQGLGRELEGLHVHRVISQFGWQWEHRFYKRPDSSVALVHEVVLLTGAVESHVPLPSLTWMVGVRAKNGAEFGFGPNLSVAGAAFAIAGGVTFRSGYLNIPVNLAVVPAKTGTRVSFLTGFNMRHH